MEKLNEEQVEIVKEIDTFDSEAANYHQVVEGQPKEPEKTDEQLYEEFLSNEENKANAVRLADQIIECVGKNWFTVRRLASKAKLSYEEALRKLQMVKMFGFAMVKIGEFSDGDKEKKSVVNVPMFKITIPVEEKIKAINDIINYHRNQIVNFEKQKVALVK